MPLSPPLNLSTAMWLPQGGGGGGSLCNGLSMEAPPKRGTFSRIGRDFTSLTVEKNRENCPLHCRYLKRPYKISWTVPLAWDANYRYPIWKKKLRWHSFNWAVKWLLWFCEIKCTEKQSEWSILLHTYYNKLRRLYGTLDYQCNNATFRNFFVLKMEIWDRLRHNQLPIQIMFN